MVSAFRFFTVLIACAGTLSAEGPHVSIAAAANLTFAVQALKQKFAEIEPDVVTTTTLGASGTLFAQIANGAPFDVFLSADTTYPQRLIAQGAADAGSFRVFATGRLVLWTARADLEVEQIAAIIRSARVHKVAIAQPKTAPYGSAAEHALKTLGIWDEAQPKLVIGENIAQTAQFIETGNADVGFVALSLVQSSRLRELGRWTEVPRSLYGDVSLAHGGVLTAHGAQNPAAKRFLQFLATPPAREILEAQGYAVPR